MPKHDEFSMHPEEIEADKDLLEELMIKTEDGQTIEVFFNTGKEQPCRLYIRNQEGKLTEYIDLEKPSDMYDYQDVKNQIAERFKFIVTDEEAGKIARKIYEIKAKAQMDQMEVLE
ncbi:MAG TPA: hypothetical protein VJ028_03130 [Patescibacteria group bacterium]|nr:hypothetical protein [Patescibacteria group bacterium]